MTNRFYDTTPSPVDRMIIDTKGARTGRWARGPEPHRFAPIGGVGLGKSRAMQDIVEHWMTYDYSKLEYIVLNSLSAVEAWRIQRLAAEEFIEVHMHDFSLPHVEAYKDRQRRKHFDPDPVKDFARSTRNV